MRCTRISTIWSQAVAVAWAFALAFCATPHARAQGSTQFLVSDGTGNKVVRYNFFPAGSVVDHFVGAGLTALNNASDMVYGPDGNLYVASPGANTVMRFNGQTGQPMGDFVASGSGGLSTPWGLAFGPDGHLYVSSGDSHRVLRYDGATGAFIDAFVTDRAAGLLDQPRGLAFNPANGDLYVVSRNLSAVLRYNGTTGAFVETVVRPGEFNLSLPHGILFDFEGTMYVSGAFSDNILMLPRGGPLEELVAPGTGGLSGPHQMAFGNDGSLLVTSRGGGAVMRFDPFFGSPFAVVLPQGTGGLGVQPTGLVLMPPPARECRADFDGDGQLTIFDFLEFQNAFSLGCP